MRTVHPFAVRAAVLMTCVASLGAANVSAADFGVFGEVGTLGLGAGLAAQVNDRFSARLSYSEISGDIDDYESEDLEFDADVKFGAGKLLLDWYPTPSSFRVTAGAMLNQTKFTGTADPTGGGYVINGTFYPSATIGRASGRVDFDRFAPYLGVGFGRALDTQGRFNVTVDVGAAFVGDPDVALTATCTSLVPTALCNQIQADIAAEQAEVEDDTDDLSLFPYANVAFTWRF